MATPTREAPGAHAGRAVKTGVMGRAVRSSKPVRHSIGGIGLPAEVSRLNGPAPSHVLDGSGQHESPGTMGQRERPLARQ